MAEDTISRKATINEFYMASCDVDKVEWAETVLKRVPSAQRKGHWKGYNADNPDWLRTDGSPIFMSCSECNGTVLNNGSSHWNYCPNCGARMDGE